MRMRLLLSVAVIAALCAGAAYGQASGSSNQPSSDAAKQPPGTVEAPAPKSVPPVYVAPKGTATQNNAGAQGNAAVQGNVGGQAGAATNAGEDWRFVWHNGA